jgi:hypothetical protein
MFRHRSSPTYAITDPQLSTARRQKSTHALNMTRPQAVLERKLATAEET